MIIFAPGVHAGGGLVLIDSLLNTIPDNCYIKAYLDLRLHSKIIGLPRNIEIVWTKQTILGRILAELKLYKNIKRDDCKVLCLHGLPPILAASSKISVFILNRLHLNVVPLSNFDYRTRARLYIEKLVLRTKGRGIKRYFVHTESTKQDLLKILPFIDKNSIEIMPLAGNLSNIAKQEAIKFKKDWDFIYPSNADWHKNHKKLLDAWVLLAHKGLFPTLVLTISENYRDILNYIERLVREERIHVVNLGALSQIEVIQLYYKSRALIYPSITEAYGLPLVEATISNLPILAGELDYVRDICQPKETFDVNSELSISRAVERHLTSEIRDHVPIDSAEFWNRFGNL